MPKLKLQADETFRAPVGIPVPGKESADVVFVFKYKTKTELDAFMEAHPGIWGLDVLKQLVLGWDLDEEFGNDNFAKLLDLYPGASNAIMLGYIAELHGVRRGN